MLGRKTRLAARLSGAAWWLLPLAAVLLLAAMWAPAQAQDGLSVDDTTVSAAFPLQLSFGVSASSDSDIRDIRLHYRVIRTSFAEVVSEVKVAFATARSARASWDWDMRRTGGLPAGTFVEYWWTVRDAAGDEVETIPRRFQFNDERFPWQSLIQGQVTIRWYEGDEGFAGEIMEAVQTSLAWLAGDTGAHLTEPIEIYIYGNSYDLRSSMVFPQEWTGGVAYTRYGRIAIGIPPAQIDWGRRAIAHELTHLVVHQMTLNPYGGLPTWLEEGLAMRSEGPLSFEFQVSLDRAVREDGLISAQSLSSPFSAFADLSVLSYAQSHGLVGFLVSEYGKDMMLALLDAFREGNTYDGALLQVYGFDTRGLDEAWRASLSATVSPAPTGTGDDGAAVAALMRAASR